MIILTIPRNTIIRQYWSSQTGLVRLPLRSCPVARLGQLSAPPLPGLRLHFSSDSGGSDSQPHPTPRNSRLNFNVLLLTNTSSRASWARLWIGKYIFLSYFFKTINPKQNILQTKPKCAIITRVESNECLHTFVKSDVISSFTYNYPINQSLTSKS